MTITSKTFQTKLQDGVLRVTLDRPDTINSLTFGVYAELRDLFRYLKDEGGEVRAVVLEGEGPKGFCSGGDQHDIIAELFARDMQGLLEFTRMTGALVQSIREARPPVIAALHGVVCGAGAVMAIACDVRIAAPSTRFAFLFPKVGLSGADMGAAYLLPRLVGAGRAMEILLTGDWVSSDEAMRIGLVTRVAEEESFRDESMRFALRLSQGPAFAHAMTKRMVAYEAHCDFATAIEAEAQAQAICMQHPDFLEAHEAWKAKRAPRFR